KPAPCSVRAIAAPTRRAAPVTSATGRASLRVIAMISPAGMLASRPRRECRRMRRRTSPGHTMTLPEPDADERAHSARLAQALRAEIAAQGPMPFSRWMERCLYAPGLGYYSAGRTKFGAAGDFVTAPELG